MSTHRTHPIYVARYDYDKGCGHQHSDSAQARNCALNMLRQHPTIKEAQIIRVRKRAMDDDIKTTVIDTVTQADVRNTGTTE
jgi:hypothetical protein